MTDGSLAPGTRLGPYLIGAPLGAGGMGVVYRAEDTRLRRPVAIKVLCAKFSANREFQERFEREARVIAALDHQHICPVYDVGEHDGSRYLVMPLLEGDTLAAQLRGGPLALRDVLRHGASLARALHAAHRAHVLHRDVKPGNVLLGRSGVKLLDFGLARFEPAIPTALTGTALEAPLTQQGALLGTLSYMAPEQFEGSAGDARTDIFALGCVIYEMATGRRAFDAATQAGVIAAIMNGEPRVVSAVRTEAPPALDRVVVKCLARDPDARWQSASDLADELEWIGSSPQSNQAGAQPVRRYTWLPLATAVGLTLLLGLLAGYRAGIRSGDVQPSTSAPAQPVSFTQLTFRAGYVHSARFVGHTHTVVYSGSFDGAPPRIYTAGGGSPESRPMGIDSAHVGGITRSGELALLLRPTYPQFDARATLARMALTGGNPRELKADVVSADWSPDGASLAVTRLAGDRYRFEYPLGVVRYESGSRLGHVRISPNNQFAVFSEDRSLRLVDLSNSNTVRTLIEGWVNPIPAWSPSGAEVWFSGAEFGWNSTLHAVDLKGHRRNLLMTASDLDMLDVNADGRVLAASGHSGKGVRIRARGDSAERDISWLDWGTVVDLSADGELLLFNEEGSGGGRGYTIYLRPTDGGPAVALGEGIGFAIAPDKQSVLARVAERFVIVPTGAGDPRTVALPPGTVRHATWFPDGTRALIALQDAGGIVRTFISDLMGKTAQIGPDRLFGHLVSPTGRHILASRGDVITDDGPQSREFVLISSTDGTVQKAPALQASDEPIGWSDNDSAIYVRTRGGAEHILWKLSLGDGRRTAVVRTRPDEVGISARLPMAVTPDGWTYAYTIGHHRRDLQMITGLK